MKTNTTTLTWIIYAVLLSAVAILINDFREIDFNSLQNLRNLKDTIKAEEHLNWFESPNIIKWNSRIISIGLLALKAYLIYGFTYLIRILNAVDKDNYFTEEVIAYFKTIGVVIINYVIGLIILKSIEAFINEDSFKFINEFKNELTYLIPCALGFYLLADIFRRAKAFKDENDMTI